jgi:histidinol phosphatase-like PHP family hydrolase
MKGVFVDFHTHTLISDGELLPSELVQRVSAVGCRGLAITDHVDSSNLEEAILRIQRLLDELGDGWDLDIIVGVELTHVPPRKIGHLADKARILGAQWIAVHGETVVEPVAPGTNRAAIEAGVDLLAHPGLITAEEASMAARQGVYLEITTRKGHSLTNGWVAQRARQARAPLLLNTDTHAPEDILDREQRELIAQGAGLDKREVDLLWKNADDILSRLRQKKGRAQ